MKNKYVLMRAKEDLKLGDLVTADGRKANPDNVIIKELSFLQRVRMSKTIEELRLLGNKAKDILKKGKNG